MKVEQKQIQEIESRERASPIISKNIMNSPKGESVIEDDVQSVQGKKGIEVPLPNYVEGEDG